MNIGKQEWLPHLPPEVVADARGWNLDAYVIALEGWRRGLTLRWHTKNSEKFKEMKTWYVDTPGKLFSLSSPDRTHYFFRTRGDKVTNEAVEIGGDKEKSKHYFKKAGVPTPEGKKFKIECTEDEIVAYAEKIKYPVVLKPTDASFGKGVVTNIKNEEQLKNAFIEIRRKQAYQNILLEKHIPGEDYRVYVVGDQAIAAMKRVPANVIGDGKSTVKKLIEKKNEERKLNPRLISCLIKINEAMEKFIGEQGYTLDSVLNEGEQLFLTDKSNVSLGGDPINVTDEMPKKIMDLAVRALKAIPGLAHGSVDLLVNKEKNGETKGVVIEVNPTSQIGGLIFPMAGKASDVPAAIIDYYFPETVERQKHLQAYFSLKNSLTLLRKNIAQTVTIQRLSHTKYKAIEWIIDSSNSIDRLGKLRQDLLRYQLMGGVKKIKDDQLQFVLYGPTSILDNFKQLLIDQHPDWTIVSEKKWPGFIKQGIEVIDFEYELLQQIKHQQQKLEKLLQVRRKLTKKHQQLLNSTSWKITRPIRKVTTLLRKN